MLLHSFLWELSDGIPFQKNTLKPSRHALDVIFYTVYGFYGGVLLMLQQIICCFNSAVHLLHESYIARESNGYTSISNIALKCKKSAVHFHGVCTFFTQQSSCSTFQNTHPWTYWVDEKPKATAAHTVVRFQHAIVLALGPVPKPHSCACPKSFWVAGLVYPPVNKHSNGKSPIFNREYNFQMVDFPWLC